MADATHIGSPSIRETTSGTTGTASNAEESAEIDISAKTASPEAYTCGVWRLGQPFEDQVKIADALDKLGPFVLDAYDCPLPLIPPGRGLFDADVVEGEGASEDVRGLQELQLNDFVEPSAVEETRSKSETDVESFEEVSDRVFVERTVEEGVDQYPSKRKRRDFRIADRSNFVKHNLRHRRRKFRKKPKLHKAPNRARQPPLAPLSQEGIC